MTATIVTQELYKQYHPPDGPMAIRGVNLAIQEGEIFGLLGPNGAGKTTLIAILCGLVPPTSGDVLIAGRSVAQDPMAAKQIIGVVPHEIALYPQLSARQNLRYFGQLYGLRGRSLDRAVDDLVAVVGMTEHANDRVAHYSNGMKRRVNVAAGLLHNPRIVLMDEPTVGLDPESRRRILNLVLQLKQDRGITVLYTTHYVEEAQDISDRVGIIHHGEIIALGTPDELVSSIHAEDTLRVHVGVSRIPATTLDSLKRVRGITQALCQGDTIILSLMHTHEVLPEILRIADQAGIQVRSLTIERPNLEAVFLHLTGQTLAVPQ